MNYSHNIQLTDVAANFANRIHQYGVIPIDNLCMVLTIKGNVQLDCLNNSIRALVHQCPEAGARLLTVDNTLQLTMSDELTVDNTHQSDTQQTLAQVFGFDQPLLQIQLNKVDQTTSSLLIGCHRLIGDEQQLYRWVKKLINHYRRFIVADDQTRLLTDILSSSRPHSMTFNAGTAASSDSQYQVLPLCLNRSDMTDVSGLSIENKISVHQAITTAWQIATSQNEHHGRLRYIETKSLGFNCKGNNSEDDVRFYIESISVQDNDESALKLDLNLREGKLVGQLRYDSALFDAAETHLMVDAFYQALLSSASASPAQVPANTLPHDELYQNFETIAAQYPEKVAVCFEGADTQTRLSYQQLNQAANHLANKLRQNGVLPGVVVGVHSERCHLSFVALLAVFKAGGIYLPLDIVLPVSQLQAIVEHSKAQLIITSKHCQKRVSDILPELVIEEALEQTKDCPNPDLSLDISRPFLLLFTSGSTGTPKGVLHQQGQLINRYRWLLKNYPFAANEVACQRTNLGYQPSLWEMLGGLLQGIPTVVMADAVVKDPYLFKAALVEHKVTHLTLVPSLLQTLLRLQHKDDLWLQINTCITAGEPLSLTLMQAFTQKASNGVLLNDYGSTETNGILYFDSHQEVDQLPGFKVVDNVHCLIVDEHFTVVPQGEIGELLVGGVSLALEYFNAATLTAEKFIHHPHSGERLFRMGDLARQRSDGSLEVLGRVDNQVKIRGNKVTFEGAELILQSCDGVVDCAIAVRATGHPSLVAYVVLTDVGEIDSVRLALKAKVADFMMPSQFYVVSQIARNANGKVDRKALIEPAKALTEPVNVAATAQTSILQQLMVISAKVLSIELKMVGRDRKFYELGFDSGNIVTLVQDINETWAVNLRLADIYDLATLNNLAKHIVTLAPQAIEAVVEQPSQPSQPQLSPPQGKMDIAIIGMSGCYAGAANLDEFWQNLSQGVDSIKEVSPQRWSAEALYSEDISKPYGTVSKWGGFIDDADAFDAAFFDMSPHEALYADPQQRLALQQSWKTLEDAGYSNDALAGRRVGVFIGHRSSDYINTIHAHQKEPDAYTLSGNDSAVLAARLAYHLNLKGPCLSLDTACSSSLTALHLACQSLQSGDSEMALAGGVNVMSTPLLYQQSSKLGMLSVDGRCKSFDNQANGFVPGEGVGFVLLKPLAQAEADGDHIYALVCGSGVNHDGRTNGMTAPNARAQQALLQKIYQQHHIHPGDIGLVETHGTGTKLGDPIEFEALKGAFGDSPLPAQSCALGAVKTNIGHAIAAAGIAGLHKLVLSMSQQKIPANLNFEQLNEFMDFASTPFYINTQLRDWPQVGHRPRLGAVSSFGFSGTNSHVVIEEYVPSRAKSKVSFATPLSTAQVIPLSAKTANALSAMASVLAQYLRVNPQLKLVDIATTLQQGRSHFEHRLALVVSSHADLIQQLDVYQQGAKPFEPPGPANLLTIVRNYLAGHSTDWAAQLPAQGEKISLPGYVFEQTRFWLDANDLPNSRPDKVKSKPMITPDPMVSMNRDFVAAVTDAVTTVIVEVTGFESLRAQEPLDSIGINSVMILMLNKAMVETFGSLPETLFYQNQSIAEVADYLVGHKGEQIARAIGWSLTDKPAVDQPVIDPKATTVVDNANTDHPVQAVAIVGLSGRYPEADDLEQLWQNLCAGKDSISEIPAERWSHQKIYQPSDINKPGSINSKWGGFLNDIDCFDPLFFNISPKEAQLLDPQERLFLQTAWHSLEDAGYSKQALQQRCVGVYVGVVWSEYQLFGIEEGLKGNPVYPNASFSSIANRVSYSLNLNGPSMAVDTMCSSSLTAIHLACQSILNGECDMAIAGGVNLSLHPTKYQLLAQGRFLSSDGRCRSFGDGGDGYVPGEGVGAVVLKTLAAAKADGDQIYGVIKGSALNHGGKTNGYTVPNPNAQGNLISTALRRAGVDANSISYIEAHGTGTDLGDPIELAGMQQAFAKITDHQSCAIGSIKSNIGHLEAAAGIAGLSKVLLQMKYGQLVPSLHGQTLNQKLDLAASPFYLQTRLQSWSPPTVANQPHRAAISAFGAGGSNAHMIIEAYPRATSVSDTVRDKSAKVFLLSARNEQQLQQQAAQLLAFVSRESSTQAPSTQAPPCAHDLVSQLLADTLHVSLDEIDGAEKLNDYLAEQAEIEQFAIALKQQLPKSPLTSKTLIEAGTLNDIVDILNKTAGSDDRSTINLRDIAYTLQVGREPLNHRLAVVASDSHSLQSTLQAYLKGQSLVPLVTGNVKQSPLDLDGLLAGDAGQQFVHQLMKQSGLRQLAQLWVCGIGVDWLELYREGAKPQRVSLPLYPFAKERYWFEQADQVDGQTDSINAGTGELLHPLVQRNVSSLHGQKFSSQWGPSALFFDHHKVGIHPTLPGVAYLEMMLTALSLSLEAPVNQLNQVVFAQPLVFTPDSDSLSVDIGVNPVGVRGDRSAVGALDVRVVSTSGDLHSRAKATVATATDVLQAGVTMDLHLLRQQSEVQLKPQPCYQRCEQANMFYGPSFQVLQQLWLGHDFALGQIELAPAFTSDLNHYRCHPAVLDGALQTLLLLMGHIDTLRGRRFLPYSIEQVQYYDSLGGDCFAYVKAVNTANNTPVFDVTVVNAQGNTLVLLKGLMLREVKDSLTKDSLTQLDAAPKPLYYQNHWPATPLLKVNKTPVTTVLLLLPNDIEVQLAEQAVLALDCQVDKLLLVRQGDGFSQQRDDHFVINPQVEADYQQLFAALPTQPTSVIVLWGQDNHFSPMVQVQPCLLLSKTLLNQYSQNSRSESVDLLFVHHGQAAYQATGGLVKTLAIENPRVHGRCIEVATSHTLGEALDTAFSEVQYGEPYVREIRYRDGVRQIRKLVAYQANPQPQNPPVNPSTEQQSVVTLSPQAVVLITGGAGKLGLISAQWVLQQQPLAQLILTGRSQPNQQAQNQINQWCEAGHRVSFIAADIADDNQVQTLISTIVGQNGRINGIIHCAGVTRDSYLSRKSGEDMAAVIGPKVAGTHALDLATAGHPLEFFVLFSSISAVLGNAGQTDYAFANSYLDCFATQRHAMVAQGQRQGKTLSINWPLWAEGGMPIDQRTADNLLRQWGVVPITAELGLWHLNQAIGAKPVRGATQDGYIFVYGDERKLRTSMCINDTEASYGRHNKVIQPLVKVVKAVDKPVHQTVNQATGQSSDISRQAQDYVVGLLCQQTKMTVEQLDIDASFDSFGVDSVMIASLNDLLETRFANLPQTLLFEVQTVAQLSEYLVQNHPEAFAIAAVNAPAELLKDKVNGDSITERMGRRFIQPPETGEGHQDIAIIGLSGRYPQANDLATFWQNLKAGKNCIEPVPAERWQWQDYCADTPDDGAKVKGRSGGFIADVDKFDPLFFNISPAEAEQMDPQERLSIEMVWHVLEDAGYTRDSLSQNSLNQNRLTGLYIGCMYKHYPWLAKDLAAGPFLSISSYWNITNRISYLFNFQGPSVAVDTACASSLTAVQMACDSIRAGQCTTAIAGGVNLSLHPDKFVGLAESGMLSGNDTSRGLGQSDGYISGEGVGMVLLKPLALAEAEGDHIYAVIKGGAINHGGKSNGFSTPNPAAQVAVAQQALSNAGLSAADISYIETAANGAELGDMIEFNALNKVYSQATQKREYCAMGTVKSNLGHLEAASGISQLTKVILQARHQTLLPSIHAQPLNPRIRFDQSAFYLNHSLQAWAGDQPRYAAVNSIGAGGANAHLIVGEYLSPDSGKVNDGRHWPILLSARTQEQLMQQVKALATQLYQQPQALVDVAFTLAVGREAMASRLVIVTDSHNNLLINLEAILAEGPLPAAVVLTNKSSESASVEQLNGQNLEFASEVQQWLQYQPVNWPGVWADVDATRVPLPAYPFERNSYWIPGTRYGEGVTNPKQTPISDPSVDIGPQLDGVDNPKVQLGLWLQQQVANQLKLTPQQVPLSHSLTELGFDSLQGMKLMNHIEKYCVKPLLASELMVLGNIEQLAEYLFDNGVIPSTPSLSVLLEKVARGEIDVDVALAQEQKIRQRILANEGA